LAGLPVVPDEKKGTAELTKNGKYLLYKLSLRWVIPWGLTVYFITEEVKGKRGLNFDVRRSSCHPSGEGRK